MLKCVQLAHYKTQCLHTLCVCVCVCVCAHAYVKQLNRLTHTWNICETADSKLSLLNV